MTWGILLFSWAILIHNLCIFSMPKMEEKASKVLDKDQ
jgi:hypothetical protein